MQEAQLPVDRGLIFRASPKGPVESAPRMSRCLLCKSSGTVPSLVGRVNLNLSLSLFGLVYDPLGARYRLGENPSMLSIIIIKATPRH